ncbi:hypothetical protein Tco_0658369 [Tanacetum coccineum]
MVRDTIQLENDVSTIFLEYLREFASEYYIPEDLHPELPGPKDTIVDFPEGKVGHFQIHFSQLSVLGVAKVSHFEINCRVLNIIPTLNLFRVFYVPSYNSGWMSFSKRPGMTTPQCYTKPLDSVKNWNNGFFWVDERIFPTVVEWRSDAPKDKMPSADTYSAADVATLDTHRAPIKKQPETLLCLVGLSRNYFMGNYMYPTFLYDDGRDMDLFNLISASNPTKVKTGTRPRAAHEVPQLTTNANHVIDMEDTVAASRSSETSSVVEKSPLDFSSEDLPPMITGRGETEDQVPAVVSQEAPFVENAATTEVAPELNLEKEATVIGPLVNKRRHKRDQSETEANIPPKVLRKDHASVRPVQNTRGGKSLAAMGVDADPPPSYTFATKDTPAALQSVSDLDPLFSKEAAVAEDPESEKSTSFTSIGGSPGSIYQPGWGVTNNCRLDTPDVCQDVVDHLVPPVAMGSQLRLRFEQEVKLLKKVVAQVARRDQRIQAREKDIKNLEALLEAEADMKEAVEAKNAKLVKELESLRVQFSDLQVSNNQLSQQVSTLQAQVTYEERIKAAFEEFKKYKDDRVNSQYAEIDARLDALSIDFDEELYPHMLTTIAGRRWVIEHGLRLAVMKCAESTKLRQAFADVVSAGIAKGMSEGLKHGIEHGKAKLDLAAIEAYDPEADTKYVAAIHALKDLKYPLVDQLEKLKDAPIDLIMASLYLESDSAEDAPQWIRELRPSSSQLKIPIYPEVRNPKDPWSFKGEILLEDDIATNISRAKKKKCRVVCRTHEVGSAHHARSDGVPVSIPTAAPQGLAIQLVDAATQIEISEDEASLRLLRSKSLPPTYNLDWP